MLSDSWLTFLSGIILVLLALFALSVSRQISAVLKHRPLHLPLMGGVLAGTYQTRTWQWLEPICLSSLNYSD